MTKFITKKTIFLSAVLFMTAIYTGFSQDDENPLIISGSVDTYFKYDF